MADMDIATATEPDLALLRLLQLVSPSLPIGGFTYSQGIEWAVECGWIKTAQDLEAWLEDQLATTIARLDLPVLLRLHPWEADHRNEEVLASALSGAGPGAGVPAAVMASWRTSSGIGLTTGASDGSVPPRPTGPGGHGRASSCRRRTCWPRTGSGRCGWYRGCG